MRRTKALESTAYHEAGHAVAAQRHGMRTKRLSIVPEPGFQPPVMALPDGAQVCDRPGHGCLVAHGNGRRMVAVSALAIMGISPPIWWEL